MTERRFTTGSRGIAENLRPNEKNTKRIVRGLVYGGGGTLIALCGLGGVKACDVVSGGEETNFTAKGDIGKPIDFDLGNPDNPGRVTITTTPDAYTDFELKPDNKVLPLATGEDTKAWKHIDDNREEVDRKKGPGVLVCREPQITSDSDCNLMDVDKVIATQVTPVFGGPYREVTPTPDKAPDLPDDLVLSHSDKARKSNPVGGNLWFAVPAGSMTDHNGLMIQQTTYLTGPQVEIKSSGEKSPLPAGPEAQKKTTTAKSMGKGK